MSSDQGTTPPTEPALDAGARDDPGASTADLEAWLADTRAWADRELEAVLERLGGPERLVEALRYSLFAGGKRLRPALVRTVCRELGGDDASAASAACAVELVHTYSLIHDDLPCMDDDDLRRGRPTCHRVYGEALAVLAGDALQAAAFDCLSRGPDAAEAVQVLAGAAGAGGMVGGQVLDLELEGTAVEAEAEAVREIHALKTAALLAAAVELGALAAPAAARTPLTLQAARSFGQALGRLFQAVDDVLDVTGDAATLGKTPGKDAAAEKATLVSALGLEGARAEARRLADEAREAGATVGLRPGSRALGLIELFLDRRS